MLCPQTCPDSSFCSLWKVPVRGTFHTMTASSRLCSNNAHDTCPTYHETDRHQEGRGDNRVQQQVQKLETSGFRLVSIYIKGVVKLALTWWEKAAQQRKRWQGDDRSSLSQAVPPSTDSTQNHHCHPHVWVCAVMIPDGLRAWASGLDAVPAELNWPWLFTTLSPSIRC